MAAPPLPPGPPPPISHPPGGSGGGGLPGAGCGWPPISDLLLREAHAWAGLLGLHGGVVQAAHALAGEQAEAGASRLAPSADEATAREQAYCAALTSLAAQCDALATEALRLRNLRKARRTADVAAIEAIIRPHAQEALAAGSALASNSALSVQTATTAIRQAMQTTKTQIAQLRRAGRRRRAGADHAARRATRVRAAAERRGPERSVCRRRGARCCVPAERRAHGGCIGRGAHRSRRRRRWWGRHRSVRRAGRCGAARAELRAASRRRARQRWHSLTFSDPRPALRTAPSASRNDSRPTPRDRNGLVGCVQHRRSKGGGASGRARGAACSRAQDRRARGACARG